MQDDNWEGPMTLMTMDHVIDLLSSQLAEYIGKKDLKLIARDLRFMVGCDCDWTFNYGDQGEPQIARYILLFLHKIKSRPAPGQCQWEHTPTELQ